MNKTIGKRIRDIRKSKDISLEKMAEKLNVSYSTYQRIENGETSSWTTHLESICEILEVPIEEIVLEKDRYVQIVKEQSTGYSGYSRKVVISTLSEKVVELYEERLKEKDIMIEQLQKIIDKISK